MGMGYEKEIWDGIWRGYIQLVEREKDGLYLKLHNVRRKMAIYRKAKWASARFGV